MFPLLAEPEITSAQVSAMHAVEWADGSPRMRLYRSSRLVEGLRVDRHYCWSDCNANADELLAAIWQAFDPARGD